MQLRYSFLNPVQVVFLIFGLMSTTLSFQAHAQIAFTSFRDGNKEIYVMDADGSNLRNLTRNPAPDYRPAWSPDGRRIAFNSDRDGNWEIYVIDADGGNPQRLTRHLAPNSNPSWSPNGEHIAFDSRRGGNNEIYVMDTEGGNLRNLTNNNDAYDARPSWSPDGERIAFQSHEKRIKSDIYVMDADGGNLQRLTKDPESDWGPDWARSTFSVSPEGRKPIMWGWLKSGDYGIAPTILNLATKD